MYLRRVATYVFMVPFFFVFTVTPWGTVSTHPHYLGLAALGLLLMAGLGRQFTGRSAARSLLTSMVVGLVAVLYFWFRQGHPVWGTQRAYLVGGLGYALDLALIAGFVGVFFEESVFVEVFWNLGRFALAAAMLGYVFTAGTGRLLLTNTGYGTDRLQGFLSEPSAWAPVLGAMFILAVVKRQKKWIAAVVVAAVLAKSPVVMVALAITLPIYYFTHRQRRGTLRAVVAVFALLALPLAVRAFQNTDPTPYLASTSSVRLAYGRLLSGVSNVRTSGQSGYNVRFTGAQTTTREVRENGWVATGFGPGSSDVYFPAKYKDVQAYSLAYASYFDFGLGGVVALGLLLGVALWRMRASPAMAVLLPFCVTSLINSAEGWELYKFAVVSVMVFAFRWARYTCATRRRSRVVWTAPVPRHVVSA